MAGAIVMSEDAEADEVDVLASTGEDGPMGQSIGDSAAEFI